MQFAASASAPVFLLLHERLPSVKHGCPKEATVLVSFDRE